MTDDPTVTIPSQMYQKCEQNIENTAFESVDEYIKFILSEILDSEERDARETVDNHGDMEEQLEALGYLDE